VTRVRAPDPGPPPGRGGREVAHARASMPARRRCGNGGLLDNGMEHGSAAVAALCLKPHVGTPLEFRTAQIGFC